MHGVLGNASLPCPAGRASGMGIASLCRSRPSALRELPCARGDRAPLRQEPVRQKAFRIARLRGHPLCLAEAPVQESRSASAPRRCMVRTPPLVSALKARPCASLRFRPRHGRPAGQADATCRNRLQEEFAVVFPWPVGSGCVLAFPYLGSISRGNCAPGPGRPER